ncbi:MAG: DinB family protein [Acidobacteriaceae bacterium]
MRLRMMSIGLAMGAVCLMSASTVTATAQMKMNAPMKMESGASSPAKALDQLLSAYEHEAMGVVNTMPADKYSFAPTQTIFAPGQGVRFATVRTFVQEVTHVAEANYYFYSEVGGMKPDVDRAELENIHTKDEAVAALAKSFRFAHKAIATITPANAYLPIKPIDGMTTRVSLAAFGVAHGYDHYGQMVEYLRMNGLVPPGSK